MPELTAEGRSRAAEVAARHGVTALTAETLLMALAATGGGQAQFSIPELGGMGQWSRGGMVMVGDMFNNALKAKVDALCSDLAALVDQPGLVRAVTLAGSGWWPSELGTPSSAGAQNEMRYAFFPEARRLAVSEAGRVTIYDTGDHRLGGFGQQQGSDRTLTFSSQHGTVRIGDLPVAGGVMEPKAEPAAAAPRPAAPDRPAASAPEAPAATTAVAPSAPAAPAGGSTDDIFGKLERLADLRAKGILSDAEFASKKTELLARL